MKQFFNIFFVVLGVIFFIIILIAIFFIVTDPFNLKQLIFGSESTQHTTEEGSYDHPLLNESQEQALKAFGINPVDVPSEITPELEACFVEKLGEERVAEIKGGIAPTAIDYFKAKDCI